MTAHVVTCSECYRFSFRHKDARRVESAIREHYATAHPDVAVQPPAPGEEQTGTR